MAVITRSVVRSDERRASKAGLIIGEDIFDDGQVWPFVRECPPNVDAQDYVDARIPEREAERAASDDAKAGE